MAISIVLVVLTGVLSLVGTIVIGGKGEKEYSSSTKKNLLGLSLIYAVLAVIMIAGLGLFIYFN
ncbi:hypothetical protein LRR81_05005 [Metabacillus sp. GX 13764]|uniref:hypothetical protein n=1 Tax=Metabacillus kandeliae TaxID=2900151 RepID=UPI001E44173F|nr:hypothetical protein [Metabacillus kandeliae]MCD7033581.1 hypothetical protein [Metabacillus kandeliae]